MPGYPADIGGAPINLTRRIVENIMMRHRRPNKITTRGVQHALWLSRRARGIENEQRVFGIHGLRHTIGRHAFAGFMIPDIALAVHCDIIAGMPDNQNGLDRGTIGQSRIDIDF